MGRLSLVLVLGLLAGCGGLRTDLEPLDVPSCSGPVTRAELAGLSPASSTDALGCAVLRLRAAPMNTPEAARACALLAERTPPGEGRERLAAEGYRAADAAVNALVEVPRAQYWRAVSLGLAVADQPTLAYKRLDALHADLQAAQAGAPAEAEGGPGRVLGALLLQAPAWPDGIGDGDRALEILKQTAKAYPEQPQNHYYLALALWTVEEDAAAAEAALVAFDAQVAQPRWAPLAARWRAEAATLRAEMAP